MRDNKWVLEVTGTDMHTVIASIYSRFSFSGMLDFPPETYNFVLLPLQFLETFSSFSSTG